MRLRAVALFSLLSVLAVACGGETPARPQLPTPATTPEPDPDAMRPISDLLFVLVVRDEIEAGDHRDTELHRLSGVAAVREVEGGVELDFHVRRYRRMAQGGRHDADDAEDAHLVLPASLAGALENPEAQVSVGEALLREQLWPLTSGGPSIDAWFSVGARTHVEEDGRSLTAWRQAHVSGPATVEVVSDGELRRTTERFEGGPSVSLDRQAPDDGPLFIPALETSATIRLLAERVRSRADGITQHRHAVRETELAGTRIRRESWFRVGAADTEGLPAIPFEAEVSPPPPAPEGCPDESRVVVSSISDAWIVTANRALTHAVGQPVPASEFDEAVPAGFAIAVANYAMENGFDLSPSREVSPNQVAGGLAERSRLRLDLVLRAPGGEITVGEYPVRDYGVEQERFAEILTWTFTGRVGFSQPATVRVISVEGGQICGVVEAGDDWTTVRGAFAVPRAHAP